MHWATLDDTDLSTIEHLDFHEETQCDSPRCIEKGRVNPHPADWYVTLSGCRCVFSWCNTRFVEFRRDWQSGTKLVHCGTHAQGIDFWIPVRPT